MTQPAPSKEEVIDNYDLTFDPGDKLNGSLYVCEPTLDPSPMDPAATLAQMRSQGLWSAAEAKKIPDEQRQAYKEQLELTEVIVYGSEAGHFLIARFHHPRFPSDEPRWTAWQAFFDSRFRRR